MKRAARNKFPRLLIVEDDSLVAIDMVEGLHAAGYRIVGPVGFLRGALDLATREAFDLALLDINLRGERIYPVADKLVERGIPFIFLTGYDVLEIPERFVGYAILQKPVAIDTVVAHLRRMTGQP